MYSYPLPQPHGQPSPAQGQHVPTYYPGGGNPQYPGQLPTSGLPAAGM